MAESARLADLLGKRRVSRRFILKGAGAAIGLGLVGGNLSDCGGGQSPKQAVVPAGATPTPAGPKRGGTLVVAAWNQLADLDPMVRTYSRDYVYDHLYYYDYVHNKVDLSIAASLENPDPLTYIFKIKPNAKHQNLPPVNGRNVTSEDVVVSWQGFVANPRAGNKGFFTGYVDHYETPDPATLVVKMKKANAWAIGPHELSGPFPTVVVPKELIDGNLTQKVAVGPGPWVMQEFDASSGVTYVRRPDGWHNGDRPYPDKFVLPVVTDPEVRGAAFKDRQHDSLAARDKLEADLFQSYGKDVVISREISLPWAIMMRADSPGGFFSDARVREAVYCAIDVQELIDKVGLGDGEFSGPVGPYLPDYALPDAEVRKAFPHDIGRAKQLLAAAGWDTNREVELKYSAGSGGVNALIANLLQNYLAAVGIKTKAVPQDPNTVFTPQTILGKDFQLVSIAQGANMDPDMILRLYTTDGIGNGNYCRWSDPEVDAIVASQQAEFDKNKQKQIILDAQRMLLKKFTPIVNLWSPYTYTADWAYYHRAKASEMGFTTLAHYSWIDVDHPAYPRDKR